MDLNSKPGKLGSINVRIEEDDWLSYVKICLEAEAEKDERLSRSAVLNVPKELKVIKETAFIPQAVSIGPYHHCRSELFKMERYKLAATRRFQNRCTKKLEDTIVADFKTKEGELKIRNWYDKYIDCRNDTLAWLMAVDAVFVLECLQIFVKKVDKESNDAGAEVKQLGRILDPSGKSSTHNTVVRDLTMLENQIPLFIVKKLLELQLGSEEKAEERLTQLLSMFVTEISPFGGLRISDRAKATLTKSDHLLEFLYNALVPVDAMQTEKDEEVQDEAKGMVNCFLTTAQKVWSTAFSLNLEPFKKVVSVLKSVAKLLMKLLSVVGRLPVLKTLKGPLSVFFKTASTAMDSNKKTDDGDASSDTVIEVPPTRDELVVPCVRTLKSAGVKFAPVDGDITSIKFDEKTKTLRLPKIRIDSNTDVLIRNLVAFESAVAPGGVMAFTRYIDFINGMVDNAEDVKILMKSGIISHCLQNDLEVANLWNGMGACVRLTKVEYLDKAVEGLNRFYAKNWMVKTMDMIRNYVFGSWQILSLSAALMMLSLSGMEAFCSVYDCQKWFGDYASDSNMTP